MKTLLTCLALIFLLPLSQGAMARNKYIYVINESDSDVTVYLLDGSCLDTTSPRTATINPHHKLTIIVKTGGGFTCYFKSTKAYFNIAMQDSTGEYHISGFEFYKGAGKDPHLSITSNPINNLEVLSSNTIRIKNH